MSTTPLPEYVDLRKIFTQQGVVSGSVAIPRLMRLAECLASDRGNVMVSLSFEIDGHGRRVISGHLEAEVTVTCQRCLEPMEIRLSDEIRLAALDSETETDRLESSLDPWICTDNKINLVDLVDEQLMLCMPIVNLHQQGPCAKLQSYDTSAAKIEKETRRPNPFAVLGKIKRN